MNKESEILKLQRIVKILAEYVQRLQTGDLSEYKVVDEVNQILNLKYARKRLCDTRDN